MKRLLFSMMAIGLCLSFTSCGEENLEFGNPPTEHVVDDDGVPSGTPGNESMFGIYTYIGTNSDIWNSFKEDAESHVELHMDTGWESNFVVDAIWIVDDKTIYWVDDYIGFSQSRPTSGDTSILLESEIYTVTYYKVVVNRWHQYTDTYYLTHYVYKNRNTDMWEGRYAMNGSQMIIHTDETSKWVDGKEYVAVDYNTLTWEYSDGTIDVGGRIYKKVY